MELDYGIASQLSEMGQLSKEFMDNVYKDVSLEADKEKEERAKQSVADGIVQSIVSDPTAADVAARVATALPTPETAVTPVPTSQNTPININLNGGTPQPAAVITPEAVPMPTGTPSPAAIQNEIQAKVIEDAAIQAQGQQAATRDRNLINAADLENKAAAGRAAEDGNFAAVKEAEATGYDLQKRGILAEAAAVSKYSKQAADFYGSQYEAMGQKAEEVAKQQAEYKQKLDERIAVQLQAVDNYSKLSIDPNRIYANQTTSDKVVGAIAIALGSFGKNGNTAIAAMDKAVKDDIELQKSQIELEGKKLNQNQNLISSMISVGADVREAEKMAEASMYRRIGLKTEEIASNMKSETARASAQQLLGQLKVKEEAAMGEAVNLAGLSITDKTAADRGIDLSKLPKEYRKNVVPGLGIAANPKAASDMIAGKQAYERGLAIVQEIGQLAEQYGVEAADTQVRVKAASLRKQLGGIIKSMETLGALDAGVERYVDGILATDPLGGSSSIPLVDRGMNMIRTNPVITQSKEAEEYFKRSYGSALRSKMIYITPQAKDSIMTQEERDAKLSKLGADISDK
jgi:hypothetical protein